MRVHFLVSATPSRKLANHYLVIGNIVDGVDRADGIAFHLILIPVNGGDAGHMTAIVADGLDGTAGGNAGGDGCHQHQHILILDHGSHIFPENDLRVGVVFRLGNIDGVDYRYMQHYMQQLVIILWMI